MFGQRAVQATNQLLLQSKAYLGSSFFVERSLTKPSQYLSRKLTPITDKAEQKLVVGDSGHDVGWFWERSVRATVKSVTSALKKACGNTAIVTSLQLGVPCPMILLAVRHTV